MRYGKNWGDVFIYDEESPTRLRWKNPRRGRGSSLCERVNKGVAGYINNKNSVIVMYNNYPISGKRIVWELFHGPLGEGEEILNLDGDNSNNSIDNLYLFKEPDIEHKYGKYLGDYLAYDEESPSCLIWKRKYRGGSNISCGDVAGHLDKRKGYWVINAFGSKLQVHKIIWGMFNRFQNQDGKQVDHIDGNTLNNKIENLRLVDKSLNARNQRRQKSNKTGVNGVVFFEHETESGTRISRYTATVYDGGKRKTKNFSTFKYGKKEAFRLACEWREEYIKELNERGYGYTERHGK